MRIATWNLEHAEGTTKNQKRFERIRSVGADIWILTETHKDLDLTSLGHLSIPSAPQPGAPEGARWVTIWSRYPVARHLDVDDPSRVAAAMLETPAGPLVVYGTVLPWHADTGPTGDAKFWSEHHRVIPLQGAEWARIAKSHPDAALCVAGDFNMNLGGPHFYGTNLGRELLRSALESAGLTCSTETERVPAGKLQHPPIDHIALSSGWVDRTKVTDAWEGTTPEGIRLSDHSGLAVEIAGTRGSD